MGKSTLYAVILTILALVAIFGLLSEPSPELDEKRWMAVFIVSKSVGMAALVTLVVATKKFVHHEQHPTSKIKRQ